MRPAPGPAATGRGSRGLRWAPHASSSCQGGLQHTLRHLATAQDVIHRQLALQRRQPMVCLCGGGSVVAILHPFKTQKPVNHAPPNKHARRKQHNAATACIARHGRQAHRRCRRGATLQMLALQESAVQLHILLAQRRPLLAACPSHNPLPLAAQLMQHSVHSIPPHPPAVPEMCSTHSRLNCPAHNGAAKYALQRANMRSSTAGPASSPALTSKARCAGPAGASRLGSRAQTCFGWCTRRGGPTAQAYRLPAFHPSSGAGGAPLLLPSPACRRCCCHPPKPQWWGPTAEACCESSSWWGAAHTPAAAAAAPLPGWLTLPQRAPAPPATLRCCRCCRAASTLPRP